MITRTESGIPEHPVWRLVAGHESVPVGVPASGAMVLCRFHEPERDWQLTLNDAIAIVAEGGVVLVAYDRALPRAVLGLLAGRWNRPTRSPSLRVVLRAIRRQGNDVDVRTRYAIWPTVTAPRVAIRGGNYRSLRWIQRSGVLGGGGRSLTLRALARSFLFTPFAFALAPGVAVVVRFNGPGPAAG